MILKSRQNSPAALSNESETPAPANWTPGETFRSVDFVTQSRSPSPRKQQIGMKKSPRKMGNVDAGAIYAKYLCDESRETLNEVAQIEAASTVCEKVSQKV